MIQLCSIIVGVLHLALGLVHQLHSSKELPEWGRGLQSLSQPGKTGCRPRYEIILLEICFVIVKPP